MILFEVCVSVLLLFVSIYFMKTVVLKRTDYIKYILITIIICFGVSFINLSLVIIASLIIITVLLGIKTGNFKRSFFLTLTACVIQIFASYLVSLLMELYYSWLNIYQNKLVLYFLLSVVVIIISKIICYLVNFRNLDFTKNSIYIDSIVMIFAVFVFIIFGNLISIKDSENNQMILYNTVIMVVALVIIITLIISIKAFYNSQELEMRREELKSLQNYISETEQVYLEMRRFKHDYINIISSIAGYIYDKNIDGLESYFEANIAPISAVFENNALKLSSLNNIEIVELKGLLTIKMIQAQEKNIQINIEVLEVINRINWDVISMCRCIGIIVDNAIEASETMENGIINVAIINNNKSNLIIVQNSYSGKKPQLGKIFSTEYSTKGKDRGLGLKNLRDIVNKEKHITLETRIDETYFTQILEINK